MENELFQKIRADDLSVKVYQRLKKAITTRLIEPGERIDINKLAEQWGVSRTPIKDAISRLTAEGLVVVKPKIGTYATRFTAKDMMELFSIRLLLEAGICSDVVQNVTKTQLEELDEARLACEAVLDKANDGFDFFLFNELDERFHELLIAASGNRKLLETYQSLNFHTQVSRYYYNKYEQKIEQTKEEHAAMVDAIRKGDAAQLEDVIRRHIQSGKDLLVQSIENGEP